MGFRLFTYNCLRVIFYSSVYNSIVWCGWSILCDRYQWRVFLFTKFATNESDPFALCWLVKSQLYRLFVGKVCDHPKTNRKIYSRHLETDLLSILYPFSYICYIFLGFTFMYKTWCVIHINWSRILGHNQKNRLKMDETYLVVVLIVSKFSKYNFLFLTTYAYNYFINLCN